jgi:hypothetical protein
LDDRDNDRIQNVQRMQEAAASPDPQVRKRAQETAR